MGDLISREAVRGEVGAMKREAEPFRNCSYKTGYISALSTIEGLLAHMEAVDAEPVRHAAWDSIDNGTIRCSRCLCYYNLYRGFAKYCPNCGAKMDKEG